jgi:AraC-like DNA-binding protein
MGAAAYYDWLKLDRVVSSQLRVRGWEKEPSGTVAGNEGAHAAVELALIESGTVKYTIGSREIVVGEGDVMIVPHELPHVTTFLTPMRGVALWLGADMVSEVCDAMGPGVARAMLAPGTLFADGATSSAISSATSRSTSRSTSSTPSSATSRSSPRSARERVQTLLRLLVSEVTDARAGHSRAAQSLCEAIVIEMLRAAPRITTTTSSLTTSIGPSVCDAVRDPRVLSAIAHMHESYADALSVDDLAKTAKMSRFHFSRLFRDEVGQAPYQYLLRVRIARATELLRSGHCSVTEAALAAGFTDFSRFAGTFKKITGKRPSDVQRQARSA